MKKTFFISMVFLSLFVFNNQAKNLEYIIGSYNIRYVNDGDTDEKSWDNRSPYWFKMVRECKFDAFGVQEVTEKQALDFESHLSDYEYIGYGRDNGEKQSNGAIGEQTGILFKKSSFEVLSYGRFFVSRTPQVASKLSSSFFNRMVVWAELKDKQTDFTFYLFSTHLDHPDNKHGEKTRKKQIKIAIKEVNKIIKNETFLFVGDFNFKDSEAAYKIISKKWSDAFHASELPPLGGYKNGKDTYTGLYNLADTASKRIDYIFFNPKQVSIKNYEAVNNKLGHSTYPSDHLPIVSTVVFK